MDDAHDIADSTDWLPTPLSGLAALENALHCQICKEFFDTPMITSCSHTFCSKCIRTAISTDGMCPACRTQDQASKLRNNWQLQEVVSAFLEARPATLKVAREQQSIAKEGGPRPGKRKRAVLENGESSAPGRTTRSKSRRLESSQASQAEPIDLDETEDEAAYEPEEQLDDGLVECPLGCGRRMKIDEVEPHLDKCEDERIAKEKAAKVKKPPATSRPQDRLNELNYGMMKEGQLAKKLREIGIKASGNRQLMIRRHTAWVNMWNASCDSNRPRTKQELMRELDVWERTQGGNAPMANSSIMRKDFDGAGWSRKNDDEFSKLIANARRSKVKAAEKKDDDTATIRADTSPETEAEEGAAAAHNAAQPATLSSRTDLPSMESAHRQSATPQAASESNSLSRGSPSASNADTHAEQQADRSRETAQPTMRSPATSQLTRIDNVVTQQSKTETSSPLSTAKKPMFV